MAIPAVGDSDEIGWCTTCIEESHHSSRSIDRPCQEIYTHSKASQGGHRFLGEASHLTWFVPNHEWLLYAVSEEVMNELSVFYVSMYKSDSTYWQLCCSRNSFPFLSHQQTRERGLGLVREAPRSYQARPLPFQDHGRPGMHSPWDSNATGSCNFTMLHKLHCLWINSESTNYLDSYLTHPETTISVILTSLWLLSSLPTSLSWLHHSSKEVVHFRSRARHRSRKMDHGSSHSRH